MLTAVTVGWTKMERGGGQAGTSGGNDAMSEAMMEGTGAGSSPPLRERPCRQGFAPCSAYLKG